MATLEQARILGGIGSILAILSIAPTVGPVLGVIGFILVLIAVKYISDITGDESIFKNYLIAVIITIVGVAMLNFIGFAVYAALLSSIVGGSRAFLSSFSLSVVGIFAALWILMIISAYFVRRSFNAISATLNVKMFSTAALLYLIGAILLIALGIGGIISFVALILQTVAFFQIPVSKA